jgi:hypothetical protein
MIVRNVHETSFITETVCAGALRLLGKSGSNATKLLFDGRRCLALAVNRACVRMVGTPEKGDGTAEACGTARLVQFRITTDGHAPGRPILLYWNRGLFFCVLTSGAQIQFPAHR